MPEPGEWGDQMRYVTDDRDRMAEDLLELVILQGGSGDWYVATVPLGERALRAVRLCTSGGASYAVPGLTGAIADAYRALWAAHHGEAEVDRPQERRRKVERVLMAARRMVSVAENVAREYPPYAEEVAALRAALEGTGA